MFDFESQCGERKHFFEIFQAFSKRLTLDFSFCDLIFPTFNSLSDVVDILKSYFSKLFQKLVIHFLGSILMNFIDLSYNTLHRLSRCDPV